MPTTYFSPSSGIGIALNVIAPRYSNQQANKTVKVGIVGLGISTLATYGRPHDHYHFVTIQPFITN